MATLFCFSPCKQSIQYAQNQPNIANSLVIFFNLLNKNILAVDNRVDDIYMNTKHKSIMNYMDHIFLVQTTRRTDLTDAVKN